MLNRNCRALVIALSASVSWGALSSSAYAQDVEASVEAEVDEVVVMAQRRGQNVQDVPATVTAVTGQQLEDLNIFRLEDVAQLSPGLSLESNGGFGSTAQLRGVGFNSEASSAPAVDVYINDTPVDANYAFQSIYDIGQIEVLRGPQGTLRGRPAPGGAITIQTRRPDLYGFNASIASSFSDQDATNVEAALNIPLIADRLALRVAGLYDENAGNGVSSVNGDLEDGRLTKSWRASLRWAPTDAFEATLTHQYLQSDRTALTQVAGPGMGYNGPAITGPQRLAVQEAETTSAQKARMTTLQAVWTLPNHRLSYSGALQENGFTNEVDNDAFNAVTNFSRITATAASYDQSSHEVIFSSTGEDRFIDYSLGAWYQRTKTNSAFTQSAPLGGAFGSPLAPSGTDPVNLAFFLPVSGFIPTDQTNKAVFANLTFHLTEATKLTAGLRYLEDSSVRSQTINIAGGLTAVPVAFPCGVVPGAVGSTFAGTCNFAVPASSTTQDGDAFEREFVYNASLSHDFTDDVMAYVSYGHSFRPAGVTVGITSPLTPDLLQGESETSDSYELGVKSQWMDRRLRVNAAVYHQDFDNFIGRFQDIPYLGAGNQVQAGGFTYPGDAKVDGAEIEVAYDVTDDWFVSLNASVSDGKYDNARVPCRDTDFDGVPDSGNNPLPGAYPVGQNVFYCVVNDSISTLPPWSMTLQSEYNFPVRSAQGYLRGLYTFYGENDNLGAAHVADSYGLLNLYLGARSDEAGWDVSLWAKNVFDEEVLLNTSGVSDISYGVFPTGYQSVFYNRPREIGVTLRYAFDGN